MKSLIETIFASDDTSQPCWDGMLSNIKKKEFIEGLHETYQHNFYSIFGLDQNRDFEYNLDIIKNNYKKLALAIHPDKYMNAVYHDELEALMKLIHSAKDTLTNKAAEALYRKSHPKPATDSTNLNNAACFVDSLFYNQQLIQKSTVIDAKSEDTMITGDIPRFERILIVNVEVLIEGKVFGVIENNGGNVEINGLVFGVLVCRNGGVITVNGNVNRAAALDCRYGLININGSNQAKSVKGNICCVDARGNNNIY